MALIKEGDRVKRRRHKKDFSFLVEKIEGGFAMLRLVSLPLTTIEPIRDLVKVEERQREEGEKKEGEEVEREEVKKGDAERIQNTQINFIKKEDSLLQQRSSL